MPLRIPLETIILRGRGPQAVKPVIGKPFDFTKAELAGILATNKDAVRELNETEAAAYAHQANVASQQNKTVAASAASAAAAKPETAKEKKDRLAAEKAAAIAAQQKAAADELAKSGEGTGGDGTDAGAGTGATGDEDI